jgi:hypothetical protein
MNLLRALTLSVTIMISVVTVGRSAEPVPGAKTVGEFLALAQVEAARSKVLYCKQTVPSLNAEFAAAFLAYQSKFREGLPPTLERIKGIKTFSTPVPQGLKDAFVAQRDEDIANTRKLDPKQYCSWFLSTLRQTTPESIRRVSEEALSRWQQSAGASGK